MNKFNTPWRRLLISVFSIPDSSVSFLQHEIDTTNIDKWIDEKNKSGGKISLFNCFLLAAAKTIAEDVPELNTYIKRGKIYPKKSVDILFTTKLVKLEGLSYVKIRDADKKQIEIIAEECSKEFKETLRKDESYWYSNQYFLSKVPWPLNRLIGKLLKIFCSFGFFPKILGISPDMNGSLIISDVSRWGIKISYGAILPFLNFPFLLVLNKKEQKPFLVDNQIVFKPIVNVTFSADHRLIDAEHAAKFVNGIQKRLDNFNSIAF